MILKHQLRAAGVKRWHIVETTREQNLAEHQFNVAMIARFLAQRLGKTTAQVYSVMSKALLHDMHEIEDGDVPSTAKPENELAEDFDDRIVQLADKIEALWFIKARHVDRPDVAEDVEQRLSRLIVQCEEVEANAVMFTLRNLDLVEWK